MIRRTVAAITLATLALTGVAAAIVPASASTSDETSNSAAGFVKFGRTWV